MNLNRKQQHFSNFCSLVNKCTTRNMLQVYYIQYYLKVDSNISVYFPFFILLPLSCFTVSVSLSRTVGVFPTGYAPDTLAGVYSAGVLSGFNCFFYICLSVASPEWLIGSFWPTSSFCFLSVSAKAFRRSLWMEMGILSRSSPKMYGGCIQML